MSKAETVQAIAETLQKFGWAPAGETRSELVIIPTTRSPRFGHCGGELREFKGRKRFQLRRCFCTVGPRTVNFYRIKDGQAGEITQARSNDLDRVAWLAEHYETVQIYHTPDQRFRDGLWGFELLDSEGLSVARECGYQSEAAARSAAVQRKAIPPEWRGDVRDPLAGCWAVINPNYNSPASDVDYCRRPCVDGTRYCTDHQVTKDE